MEAYLENIIKDKEDSSKMAIVPLDAIPISELPSIGTATAPTTSAQTPSAEQVT